MRSAQPRSCWDTGTLPGSILQPRGGARSLCRGCRPPSPATPTAACYGVGCPRPLGVEGWQIQYYPGLGKWPAAKAFPQPGQCHSQWSVQETTCPRLVPPLSTLGPRISSFPDAPASPPLPQPPGPLGSPQRSGEGSLRAAPQGVGGQAERGGVFGAWQMQGLLQGLLVGQTLAPALEMQVGVRAGGRAMGQASANSPLGSSPTPSPEFPRLQAGFSWAAVGPHSASRGTSEASARQMGHVRLAWGRGWESRGCMSLGAHLCLLGCLGGWGFLGPCTLEMCSLPIAQETPGGPGGGGGVSVAVPLTICRHTWCGTRGCRVGHGAAAGPQSH